MVYGDFYSQLSTALLSQAADIRLNKFTALFTRLYLKLFGYPDLASWMRFRLVTGYLRLTKDDTLLDVGSGNGIYANQYAYYIGIPVLGLEGRKKRVELSRLVSQTLSLKSTFRVQNLERALLPTKQFSKIICIEVLEHIVHDRQLLSEMAAALKTRGTLVITVPSTHKEETKMFESFELFAHVREGYTHSFFKREAGRLGLHIVSVRPYFFFFTKYTVRIQQWIFKSLPPAANIITYPFLQQISRLDEVFPLPSTSRGLCIVLTKYRSAKEGGV